MNKPVPSVLRMSASVLMSKSPSYENEENEAIPAPFETVELSSMWRSPVPVQSNSLSLDRVALSVSVKSPPLERVITPPFMIVAWSSVTAALMVRVDPDCRLILPLPEIVPPDQVEPVAVTLIEFEPVSKFPAERVKLAITILASSNTVSDVLRIAESPAPGTVLLDQLAAVLQ